MKLYIFQGERLKHLKTETAQITDYGEDDGFTELSFLTFHTRTHEDDVLIAKITVFRTFSIFLTTLKKASVVILFGLRVSAANCRGDLSWPISSSALRSLVWKRVTKHE